MRKRHQTLKNSSKMKSRYKEQTAPKNLFEVGLRDQLDQRHELYQLAELLPWGMFEEKFSPLYAEKGRPAKPIRRMVGLLYLKQLKNLSDEGVCESWLVSAYACRKMKEKPHYLQTKSTKAVIGQLKGGFSMVPCWVKGAKGASVKVMMAAAASNKGRFD
jgi:hypothetical protein